MLGNKHFKTSINYKFNNQKENNNMTKPIGIALLVVGVILIIFGINASNSIGSDFLPLFHTARQLTNRCGCCLVAWLAPWSEVR